MRRRLVLVTALAALALGQPAPALARDCEDVCADKAVERCDDLDSVRCGAYIGGCLLGCSVGQLIRMMH
ncbi:MAG: hypothetical protein GTO46_11175 [Gemmatimonadetes bacterium]|nr:hypothetical protein [Gemmatimonadota bacterium]NIO32163.1 hypothetical protein [Gemmatimonadota bacterium]